MEGLIPYLIDVIKKQQQHKSPTSRTYHRSFSHSDSSNDRSYHMLLGSSEVDGGSSHRRTRSDLPPSVAATNFLEGQYGKDGFLVSPRDPTHFPSSPPMKYGASSRTSQLVSRNSNYVRKFWRFHRIKSMQTYTCKSSLI